MANRYTAYGLIIASDIDLPGVRVHGGDAPADVQVLRGLVDTADFGQRQDHVACARGGSLILDWPSVATFEITGPDLVRVEPAADASDALVALPLLGTVIAIVLQLRSLFVLHGSAIEIDGKAAIFLGDKGAGKSTTAAALLRAGHRLLADDVVAIRTASGDAPSLALPAMPHIKLTQEAANLLGAAFGREIDAPHPDFTKVIRDIDDRFQASPMPVAGVYILAPAATTRIEALPRSSALSSLIRFSYVTRYGTLLLEGARMADHMRRCATLAGHTRCGILHVRRDLDRLGDIVDLVEADLSRTRLAFAEAALTACGS